MTDVRIHEAGPFGLTAPVEGSKPGRFKIQLMTPGWGSSGYYSEAVVKQAATDKVFAAGTQMFVDHPTESEKWERPERSLRDLGAVLVTDPVWDGKALVAEAQVFSQFAGSLAEMRDAIGVSIRARGTYEPGEAEGQSGRIITALKEGDSVDFVTNAGRGGRIIDVLESMRPSRVVERAVGHGLEEATANDTRTSLDAALDDRFGNADNYVWVCDFDAEQVWYQVSGPDSADTYQLAYTITDDAVVTLSTDEPVEVTRKTTYVPVGSAGGSTTTEESEEGTVGNISIDEAEHRRLTEAAQRASEAEARATAAEERATRAEGTVAEAGAMTDATTRATALCEAATDLTAKTRARIIASVTTGLPMRDGQLDVAAFESRVRERITSEATYAAELLAEAGVGRVTGEGGPTPPAGGGDAGQMTEAQIDAELEKEFGTMGLSEAHAKTATAGRG